MKQMIFDTMSQLRLIWWGTHSRFLKFKFFTFRVYKMVGLLLLRTALLSFIILVGAAIASTMAAIILAMVDSISWFDNFKFLSDTTKFLSFDYWRNENKDTSRSEIVRNLGLVLAAFIGLAVALWRLVLANKQQTLAERSLITDRINKAVENLGHQAVEVKLGGVHILWRLIEEIPSRDAGARRRDVEMILDILTSFVRHDEEGRVIKNEGRTSLRVDVETAAGLLGDPRAPYRSITPNYKLDLRGANLSGARLDDCDFRNTNFFSANLFDAVLLRTNLSESHLAFAEFSNAGMHDAILTDADLTGVDLTNAMDMTQEQINSAYWHDGGPPKLPEGLIFPPQKPEEEE